jgi:hypothetical protein
MLYNLFTAEPTPPASSLSLPPHASERDRERESGARELTIAEDGGYSGVAKSWNQTMITSNNASSTSSSSTRNLPPQYLASGPPEEAKQLESILSRVTELHDIGACACECVCVS